LDHKGAPVKKYEIDPHTNKPKVDRKGRPIAKRTKKQPVGSDSEDTIYSVDSTGNVKLDRAGNPVPTKYIVDPKTREPKVNSKNQPIMRSRRRPRNADEYEHSVDSLGEVKVDRDGNPKLKYKRDPKTDRIKRNKAGQPIP